MRRFIRAVTICILSLLATIAWPGSTYALTDKGYEALHSFSKVLHYVEENYAGKVDEEKLIQGAIYGMMSTLDPHSVYMSPEVYRELKVDTRGRFDGIGIEVTVRKGFLTVVSPIRGTPADDAGIQAGDQIVRINGKSTLGLNLSEAVRFMRGKRGSRVTLILLRKGKKKSFEVTVTRQVIKVPSVTAELLDDGYGYISIINFQQGTAKSIKKALKEMRKELGKDREISGLIIDLRKNPGGLLDQAGAVSDLFLSEGTIVSTEARGKEIDRRLAYKDDTEPDYPMVILVDGGSASASEIVAGALQDNGRAVLMGTNTFGKGSVQTVIDLDDGSGLKLTIARYLTPKGKIIQDQGIKPDITVPAKSPEEKGKEEEKKSAKKKRDYQFEKAFEYIRNPKRISKTGK